MRIMSKNKNNMQINILEETQKKLVFEVPGENATLLNILREELWNDEHVRVAAYRITHPLTKIPRMIVETDGKETPKQALISAAKRVLKTNKSFSDALNKVLK